MMMESIGLEEAREAQSRHAAWFVTAAVGLMAIAVALAWLGGRHSADDARQRAVVGELQLAVRDVNVLASLVASGNKAAPTEWRARVAQLESTLAVLMTGGTQNGEGITAAEGSLHARVTEFATHWTEFKRRSDTLFASASPEAQAAKDATQKRALEKRPSPNPSAQKPAARGNRDAELGASAVSLLSAGHGLARRVDGLQAELDVHARTPWLRYLAGVCVLGALTALIAFAVSVRRSGQALRQTTERANAQLLDALRPALGTLHIQVNPAVLADPAALGRRLSDEILAVVDGVKTLVKALDAATAEADKFAVIGHLAARALADAEQKAADTSGSLQGTARRIAAVYSTLSANAGETQQQCAQSVRIVNAARAANGESARSGERFRERVDALTKRHAQTIAVKNELVQRLFEAADLLTQAEGFALRAGDRLAGSGATLGDDLRGYLGPSVALLKKAQELAQRMQRDAEEFATELTQVDAIAADQCRMAANGAHVLTNAEETVQALSAKLSSMTRLASATEASQLLSALDESVRQIAHSSASARRVLDATQNAATRIEHLAKLLNTMKPS